MNVNIWKNHSGLLHSPVANRIIKLHHMVRNAAKAHLEDCYDTQ